MTATSHTAPGVDAPTAEPADDDRMSRNAASLVIGSGLTSVLGFAFWVVAARTMSKTDVGLGGATVAALVLLGNVSTLGLRNALPRFLPSAGTGARRLILRSYAAVAAAGVVCAGVFVLGARLWAPDLVALHGGIVARMLFIGAVVVWAIFVLQDSVLIGLRHATWVPIENFAYAVGKLALLVVIASTGSWALLIAWVVPALVIIGPLNIGIFGKLITRSEASGPDSPASWRSIGRFAGGDHLADTIRYLGAEGVVLIVVAHVGAEVSAPLFFAITIAATLGLVSSNIVSAFVAEASARPHAMETLLRRAARQAAMLVVPAALVAAIFAPLGLSIFGSEYSAEGTTVLRLLLLATIPQIITSLAIGVARFHRRVADVVRIAIASSVTPLVGAAFLVPRFGIVAIGWSFLLGQTLLACELLRRWSTSRTMWGESILQALILFRGWMRQQRRRRAAATLFDELDATRDGRSALHPRRLVPTESDVVVAVVEQSVDPVVVKIALSEAAADGLRSHERAVAAMRWATDGTRSVDLLPRRVETGVTVGQPYLIETACPGETTSAVDADTATVHAVVHALVDMYRATLRPATASDGLVARVVDAPMQVLFDEPRLAERHDSLERVRSMLVQGLSDRQLAVARTHGDLWLGNVLLGRSDDEPEVTGIIDWENSLEVGLPEVDLAHLWLTMQKSGTAGGVLMAIMRGSLSDVLDVDADVLPNGDLPAGLAVTLAWLAHVAAGLQRSTRFGLGRIWIGRNVLDVLDVLDAVAEDQLDRRPVVQ